MVDRILKSQLATQFVIANDGRADFWEILHFAAGAAAAAETAAAPDKNSQKLDGF